MKFQQKGDTLTVLYIESNSCWAWSFEIFLLQDYSSNNNQNPSQSPQRQLNAYYGSD